MPRTLAAEWGTHNGRCAHKSVSLRLVHSFGHQPINVPETNQLLANVHTTITTCTAVRALGRRIFKRNKIVFPRIGLAAFVDCCAKCPHNRLKIRYKIGGHALSLLCNFDPAKHGGRSVHCSAAWCGFSIAPLLCWSTAARPRTIGASEERPTDRIECGEQTSRTAAQSQHQQLGGADERKRRNPRQT